MEGSCLMADTEQETPFDDFAVEITDLDQPAGPVRRHRPRLTPHQRRLSLAATTALFVLVMGLLLTSASEVRGLLGKAFDHSAGTPGPSTFSGPLSAYLRGNPTWAHFTLDGKPLPPV